ncbi:hypothetical protein D051_0424 [Vibrio parahaemolyticus VPCR-2010]|nr:hypothetical protein D051_0424 [Vibrio parahaemolyticus VPCR-2010]
MSLVYVKLLKKSLFSFLSFPMEYQENSTMKEHKLLDLSRS